ncbi:hypothetical protein FHS70_004898 [Flammeovirga yaeyamensis]|nr:hypothetical protein [Flammeovirga yaeyamensis]
MNEEKEVNRLISMMKNRNTNGLVTQNLNKKTDV